MTHVVQNRISLKKLRVADFASQETLCFKAIVLLDGSPIAEARNDGNGGCTFLHALKGAGARLVEAEAFARTLPPLVTDRDDPKDPSRKSSLSITLDFLVDLIAEEMHAENRIRAAFNRDMAGKVLYVKGNRLLYLKGLKPKSIKDKAALYKQLRSKHGAEIVLAELPPEEAFALWKAHTVDVQKS